MISWLQTVIQRNHKVLFSVLLIVIIIAFVFTIGDFGGVGPGSRADQLAEQKFYGYDLNNPRVRQDLTTWTSESLRLNMQPQPTQEQYTLLVLQRALGLHLADQLQIPAPDSAEFTAFLQQVPAFIDPQTGMFSRNRSQEIIDFYSSNPQMGEALLSTVLIQDYRIDKVLALLGGPGYVLPQLAESTIQQRKTQWTLEVATLARADVKAEAPAQADLEAYYEANKERYKPENEILAGYVAIPFAAFTAEAGEPTDAQLNSFYTARSTDWPKDENGRPKALADIRAEVVTAWQQSRARELAENATNKLALALYNATNSGNLKADAQSVSAFLESKEQKLLNLPAFRPADADKTDDGLAKVRQIALGLRGQDRFFSGAVTTDNQVVLAFLFGEQEQPTPALADIREQVAADYTAEQQLRLFAEKTQSARADLEKALAEGKSFEDVAKALGLSTRKIDSFTLETLPEGINPYILFAAFDLQQGQLSQPLNDAEGGSIVYVAERKAPQSELNAEELSEAIARLQPMMQRATITSVIGDLLNVGEQAEERAAGY